MKWVYWVSVSHWGLFPWVTIPDKWKSYAYDQGQGCEIRNTKSYMEELAYEHHVNQNKRRK